MIFWSEHGVYCLKKVRRVYFRHEVQQDDLLVLIQLGGRGDKDLASLPLENRKEYEAHNAEICGDGTLHFGIIDFNEAATPESWITIKCDPASMSARFLSENLVYEMKIVDGKIEMKRVAQFFSDYAPIGEIARGDKIYFDVYNNIILYDNGEKVESFYSTRFREFP